MLGLVSRVEYHGAMLDYHAGIVLTDGIFVVMVLRRRRHLRTAAIIP